MLYSPECVEGAFSEVAVSSWLCYLVYVVYERSSGELRRRGGGARI